MNITNARYADQEQTAILAAFDGQSMCIPVDPGNRHYQELTRAGVEIAPYTPGEI